MDNRGRKRELSEILKPYLYTAIFTAAAVVAFLLVWIIVGGNYRKAGDAAQTSSVTSQSDTSLAQETDANIMTPTADDGSGRAGIQRATAEMLAVTNSAGKYSNDIGSWYAPRDGYCYYNGWVTLDGNKYHFNSSGYMDTGWKAIGGQGYYFDENGINDPNKDSSMMIALTFDDGPSQYTSQVLDILEQNGAKATFMMLGTQMEKYGDVIQRMASMGNTIGNHSMTHSEMLERSADEVVADFQAADNILANYGLTSAVVRFPYGDYTKELTAAVGKPNILWDEDSLDWDSRNAESIKSAIYSLLEPGGIILMHDIYPETLEAVSTLVPELIAQGYQLVNLQDLAASRGYELKNGVTYFSFKQLNIDQGRVNDE